MKQRAIRRLQRGSVVDTGCFYLDESEFMSSAEFMEMLSMDSLALSQYLTPMHHFYTYVSRQFQNIPLRYIKMRDFVLSFKEGSRRERLKTVTMVSQFMLRHGLKGKEYTFVCIPASSADAHERRYRSFMSEVSRRTGVQNGYELISVTSSRKPVHEGGSRGMDNNEIVSSLKGKKIILFDDVYTTGGTFTRFSAKLEAAGAEVIQSIFLADADNLGYSK